MPEVSPQYPPDFRSLDGTPQPSAVMPMGSWREVFEDVKAWHNLRKAAPDLLYAAKRLQEFVDRVWGGGWDLSDEALAELDSILDEFPPAIRKAEGRES